jgi:RNA polymerase sigma factor (sigma-70 family)
LPDKSREEILNLIRRCLAGDEAAWDGLIRLYGPKLRNWVLRHGSSRHSVDDLLQDFWLYLFSNKGRVLATYEPRDGASFDAWLYVVHRRFCIRWFMREARRSDPLTELTPEIIEGGKPESRIDPDVKLELLRRIETRPRREREIFWLSYQGCSAEEIGARYSLTANNIRVILHRIRQRLRGDDDGAL